MENGRTYQQNLVWVKLHEALESLSEANNRLESRAARVVTGSAAAIAAIAGVNMLPASIDDATRLQAALLALLCISLVAMFWFASRMWGPRPKTIPCTSDVDVLYDQYIAKTEDEAFNKSLIDTAQAFDETMLVNRQRGRQLRRMFMLLQLQALVLALIVLSKAFGW